MKTNGISINEPLVRSAPNTSTRNTRIRELGNPNTKINPATYDPLTKICHDVIPFASTKHRSIGSDLLALAKTVRNQDRKLETIETYIDKMKDQLGRLVKNYPPFPPGSEERVKVLKGYKALWQLIDRLMIPSQNKNGEQAMLENAISTENGRGYQELQIGPGDLTIPDLFEESDNEEVIAVLENLDQAKQAVKEKRERLFKDTSDLGSSIEFARDYPGDVLYTEPWDTDLKGKELEQKLKTLSGNGLTTMQSELLLLF